MDIIIREAVLADYSGINTITKQVHRFHAKNRKDIFLTIESPLTENDYKSLIANSKKNIVIVAENEEKEILGYAIVQVQAIENSQILNNARVYIIDSLAIEEGRKRLGIGKKIMEYIKDKAKKDGANRIVLNVWEFNQDAMKFYDSIGMKVQSVKYEEIL